MRIPELTDSIHSPRFDLDRNPGLTHHNRLSWKSGKNLRFRLVVYSRAGVKDGEFDFLG